MIELDGVRLDHPRSGEPLVRRADLAVAGGEVVVVVGAAGAGASRLVAALLGEAIPDGGTITVLGRDVTKLRRAALRIMRRSIGVVPQDLCLLDDRTAELNVTLPLEIDGVPRTESTTRAATALGLVGLAAEADRAIEHLAWSSRQRVAVARALVRDPSVIVADQPTSLQDEAGTRLVCGAFAAAAAAGAAVLILGRDPLLRAEAARRGWRKLYLDDGYLSSIAPETIDLDDVIDMVIESIPVTTPIAGEGDADSDGIPNVLPFPVSASMASRTVHDGAAPAEELPGAWTDDIASVASRPAEARTEPPEAGTPEAGTDEHAPLAGAL
jgi:ABC-type ATPase involved in cell division